MSYTPQFEKEYEDGWVDFPSEETLITAHALNMYDDTLENVEDYLSNNPIIQTSVMPIASEDELGNIYQYMGATDANYTQGYFYKCMDDGEEPPLYFWARINVQPGGGGGGALSDLDDVYITSPTDGQALVYDDENDKWVNGTISTDAELTNDYWNSATSYVIGDIVIYLNGLYRCIVANTGQTPTDTVYWEAISLTDIAQPKNVELTDFITMESNFSLVESRIYKQGYHVFGDLVIKKSSNYGSSSDVVGNIKSGYRPVVGVLPLCVLGADEWNSASVGYCYITSAGALRIADQVSSNKKSAKVHIDYMTV